MVPTFDYAQVEPLVRHTLYDHLGNNIAVGTEEVDNGRIFIKVVSPTFNGLTEKQKQDNVWSALQTLGPTSQAVSMVLAFGTDEI